MVIEFFGNDTTTIQGFRVFLDGFSGATNNSVYGYYLFDTINCYYVKSPELSDLTNPQINLTTGIVSSGWNGGARGMIGGRTTYKLLENGQLEFLRSWNSELKDAGYLVERIEVRNGRRIKWSKMVTTDEWQKSVC